jgi:hypothetical protein
MVLLAVLHKPLGGLIKGRVAYLGLKDLLEAAVSTRSFLQLTLCPKVRCQSLELGNEQVRFYQQECCYHSCAACGWGDEQQKCWRSAPGLKLPALYSTTEAVGYSECHAVPRGYNKKTQKHVYEDELVTVEGTHAQLIYACV